MLMQELDQCYYCLFKYPSNVKKAKTNNKIFDHGAEQVHDVIVCIGHLHAMLVSFLDSIDMGISLDAH